VFGRKQGRGLGAKPAHPTRRRLSRLTEDSYFRGAPVGIGAVALATLGLVLVAAAVSAVIALVY